MISTPMSITSRLLDKGDRTRLGRPNKLTDAPKTPANIEAKGQLPRALGINNTGPSLTHDPTTASLQQWEITSRSKLQQQQQPSRLSALPRRRRGGDKRSLFPAKVCIHPHAQWRHPARKKISPAAAASPSAHVCTIRRNLGAKAHGVRPRAQEADDSPRADARLLTQLRTRSSWVSSRGRVT